MKGRESIPQRLVDVHQVAEYTGLAAKTFRHSRFTRNPNAAIVTIVTNGGWVSISSRKEEKMTSTTS